MNSTDSEVSSMGPRQDPMGISSIISPNVGHGGHDIATTSGSKLHNVEYSLKIRQQPIAARSCGLGEKDRRVIDPPPVVQLMIKGPNLAHSRYERLLHGNQYIMNCSLYDDSGSEVATFITKQGRQERQLLGTLISTPFVGKDEHDLSCRIPGSFRLKFRLVEIDPTRTDSKTFSELAEVNSYIFTVHNAKDFPGIQASTELVKRLRDQGCIIPIKKGVKSKCQET
ncbi:Sexual development regulator velC [Fusarium culmorum]|uniref:Sexual development regulator velC n=1 Tax=Fusarium culmorum TaxID=5516 RepID=A0A2T4GGF9_FUSCU|nr:Sexual development regulator velC [Fusarium culmorum]